MTRYAAYSLPTAKRKKRFKDWRRKNSDRKAYNEEWKLQGKNNKKGDTIIEESSENAENSTTKGSDDELKTEDSFMEIKSSPQDEEFGFKLTDDLALGVGRWFNFLVRNFCNSMLGKSPISKAAL